MILILSEAVLITDGKLSSDDTDGDFVFLWGINNTLSFGACLFVVTDGGGLGMSNKVGTAVF